MSTTEYIQTEQECIESAKRAMAWLLEQQRPDGGWKPLSDPPVDAFYKVGTAFSLMGEAAAAERMLDYVKAHLLQSDGDFLPRGHEWHSEIHYQYANGWLVISAQKQGRYDIAVPAVQFLLTQQDPDHGGFYSQKSVGGEKKRSDTMSTGISGIACLAAGQLDAAKKVVSCFERMIEMQPAPTERFYTTLEADGRLGTEFPEDEAFWRVIDTQKKDQCWYAVGLPFTVGVLLYHATRENRYAELADWFLDFQLRCVNPWDGGSSGKAAWGSSMPYRVTGEPRYRDIALQVARNYMAAQSPDGWYGDWEATSGYGAGEGGAPVKEFAPGDFDGTGETIIWLGLIGSNLLARDSD